MHALSKVSTSKLVIVILAIVLFGLPTAASSANPVEFDPVLTIHQTRLSLSGTGVLRYLGLIRIYKGALYLPPETDPARALEDVAKRLEVQYLRSFTAEDFTPATNAGIRKNVDPVTFARLKARIDYHNSLYQDINPGDRVALTYVPSFGTTVEINGITKGTIKGADFARALFSMWLGDEPFDAAFKRALTGDRR